MFPGIVKGYVKDARKGTKIRRFYIKTPSTPRMKVKKVGHKPGFYYIRSSREGNYRIIVSAPGYKAFKAIVPIRIERRQAQGIKRKSLRRQAGAIGQKAGQWQDAALVVNNRTLTYKGVFKVNELFKTIFDTLEELGYQKQEKKMKFLKAFFLSPLQHVPTMYRGAVPPSRFGVIQFSSPAVETFPKILIHLNQHQAMML